MAIPFAALAMGAALGGGGSSTKVTNSASHSLSSNVNPNISVVFGGDATGFTRGEASPNLPSSALTLDSGAPSGLAALGAGLGLPNSSEYTPPSADLSSGEGLFSGSNLLLWLAIGGGAFFLLRG